MAAWTITMRSATLRRAILCSAGMRESLLSVTFGTADGGLLDRNRLASKRAMATAVPCWFSGAMFLIGIISVVATVIPQDVIWGENPPVCDPGGSPLPRNDGQDGQTALLPDGLRYIK